MRKLRLRTVKTVPKDTQLINGRAGIHTYSSPVRKSVHCAPTCLPSFASSSSQVTRPLCQASVSYANSAQLQSALCPSSFVSLSPKAT